MTNLPPSLVDVVSRAKRRFPDHTADVRAFPVCLPVYEVRLKVTELAEGDFTAPARFILQLLDLQVTQPEDIAKLLGMSEYHVAGAAVELLKDTLVVQQPDRSLAITDHGKELLQSGGKTRRPRNRHLRVPYDSLTKRIIDLDVSALLDREDVRRDGHFVTPIGPRRPRLSNIRLEDVKDYVFARAIRRDKTEILDVSDIKDIRLKYRNDIILVRLVAPRSTRPSFAAYRAQQYLEEESAAIQRLADRGIDLMPEDLKAEPVVPKTTPASASVEESALLSGIEALTRQFDEADLAIEEAKVVQGTTQDHQERISLAARIEELELTKKQLETQLGEREHELRELNQGMTRVLRTEEHRPLLLYAIAQSTSQLIIVSAWISPAAFDDELRESLAAAIRRGIQVRIGWGLGATNKPGAESTRLGGRGRNLLDRLRKLIPSHLQANLVVRTTETHEKFIICDDSFCAWGSFNWLSYRGERDSAYRRETSYYSERRDDIAQWQSNAEELFQGQ